MSVVNRNESPTSPSALESPPATPSSPLHSPPFTLAGSLSFAVSTTWNGLVRRVSGDDDNVDTQYMPDSKQHWGHMPEYFKTAADTYQPPPKRRVSPFQPPPLYPLSLSGYKSSTPDSAQLLSKALAEEIRLLVPPRLQLCDEWKLAYSLEQDGVSLATLYEKSDLFRGQRSGFVLVVRDGSGGVGFPRSSFWNGQHS
jgi:hypothetical protein